jgi:hypothetical protein
VSEQLWRRLPRDIDQDLVDSKLAERRQKVVAGLVGLSQPAVAYRWKQVQERIRIIRSHPELQVADGRDNARKRFVRALRDAGFRAGEARLLFELFWTSSPRAAARLSRCADDWRTLLQRLRSVDTPNRELRRLLAGIDVIEKVGWGCLWGRAGRRARPGSKGNRLVEGVTEAIDIDGNRKRVRRRTPPGSDQTK